VPDTELFLKFGTTAAFVLAAAGSAAGAKSITSLVSAWFDRGRGAKIELRNGRSEILLRTSSLTSEQAEAILGSLQDLPAKGLSRPTASATEDKKIVAPKASSEVARERVVIRIAEVRGSYKSELSAQRWSRWSSNLLTVAQVVIGGVLASSFIQESLSRKWVGGLGLLVLVSSLFKQSFHPELEAEKARKKAILLQALIRSSEDSMAILDAKIAAGQDHSDAMIALMTLVTQRLSEIENSETAETKPKGKGK
jgi:hypothetical protein